MQDEFENRRIVMEISVLIPTFNSERWILQTLESVLRQTKLPQEILVLDDGSTDSTVSILAQYKPRISILRQSNRGVAHSRNILCQQARGEILAFLDHDDIWHSRYLEMQSRSFEKHPEAVAAFSGHVDFRGQEEFKWSADPLDENKRIETIEPLTFSKKYNHCPALFSSMSFCCIPRATINKMDKAPFMPTVSGADDFFLFNRFPLFGPVVYNPQPLVAYRITREAQSSDRLKGVGLCVNSFAMLWEEYKGQANTALARAFLSAYASKTRVYAKLLMGAGRFREARGQLLNSLKLQAGLASFAKSAALLGLTQLPGSMQPAWPSATRVE